MTSNDKHVHQLNQKSIERLKIMREKFQLAGTSERYKFLRQLDLLIRDWQGQLPDLRDIFRPNEIDCLLKDSVNYQGSELDKCLGERFIDFVIETGYKDKPEVVSEASRPFVRRTTALHWAAKYNHSSVVGKLFEIYSRCDVTYFDLDDDYTHFRVACKFGCYEVVKRYLELGQDPNCLEQVTISVNSPWYFFIIYQNERQKSVDPPLYLALSNKCNEVARLLLERGANPSLTLLHMGKCHFENDSVELLFEIMDDMQLTVQDDARDDFDDTLLHLALLQGNEKVAEWLLRRGADPYLTNKHGQTALHIIGLSQFYGDLVDMFFKIVDEKHQPVQVDTQDEWGSTPLHSALRWNNKKAAEALLVRGASPHLTDRKGSTPLHEICSRNNEDELVKVFFEINNANQRTVQVDAKDNEGRTPLQLAVAHVLPNTVDLLLEHGADVSSFVFPAVSYFEKSFQMPLDLKLRLACGLMSIVEHLEKRGYELDRSDALIVMKLFSKYGLFEKSSDSEKCWYDDEEFAAIAKNIMMNPKLSLLDSIQLRPHEAAKQLTCSDYYKFAYPSKLYMFNQEHRELCEVHLCEKLSRKFFRRWALDSFRELIHYRLPLEMCEMIIDESFTNKDLYNICLATGTSDHEIL